MKFIIPCTDSEGFQFSIEGEGDVNVYESMQIVIKSKGWNQTKKSVFIKKENEKFDPTITKVCSNCGAYMPAKEGVNAQGKPWCGWFCPNSKEKGCKPVWAKK